MHTLALYYPYIRIPNDEWLRSSLLLWDRVGAIAPAQAQPEHNHISQELRRRGLVQFIDPMDHYEVLISREFSRHFKSLMKDKRIRAYIDDDSEGLVSGMHADSFGHTDGIRREKLSGSLSDYLIKKHGAVVRGDWIYCNPKVADVYMTYLASQLSSIWYASPLTNIPELDELRDTVAAFLEKKDGRIAMSTVTTEIHAELPQIPLDYSIDQLIDLKNKHRRYYDSFRNRIINLRAGLAKAKESKEVDYILDDFGYGMYDSLSSLQDLADKEKWDIIHATVRTTFSVSAIVAGLLLAVDPSPGKMLGLGASGLILEYKYNEELRKIRLEREKALHDNDFSYLYLLKRDLN